MKISFVLPVYNCAAYIAQTIESLLRQDHEDFEIIIVNDGSTDDVEFVLEHYKKPTKVEVLTHSKRMGGAASRNRGNEFASGGIIGVCDAGDIYSSRRAQVTEDYFEEHPNVDLFYSSVNVVNHLEHPLYTQPAAPWDGQSKPPISHPTVAYRTKLTDACKYHEESKDTDFYEFFLFDCSRKGFKMGYTDEILCNKIDLTSSSNYRNVKDAKDQKFEKYKQYGIEIERQMV